MNVDHSLSQAGNFDDQLLGMTIFFVGQNQVSKLLIALVGGLSEW